MDIIKAKTQEEFNRLMEYLERDEFRWASNSLPTDDSCKNYWSVGYKIKLENKEITGSCLDDETITVDEYLNEVDPETERKYYGGFNYSPAMNELYREMSYFSTLISKNPFYKLKDKTMSIVEFAKDLTLSKNEKLLRKHGLKDECGVWSDEAIEIEAQLACDDKTDKFVEIAMKKDEEEKK